MEFKTRELWGNSVIKSGWQLYKLEEKGDVALFVVKSSYIYNHNVFYHTTFHVWCGDKEMYTGTGYITAYNLWKIHSKIYHKGSD